ncbi:glutathione-regulated potassium-efflux system protein KefB [Leminorella grimontii]|uniref:Glutathione-regulated potassium-efflux system protein KefB n=2 Tax=Leminorella grimontii TaxID=82981 RepID=A0AAV5N2B0_9GAMM|nr:cation:proton antiporter [Leminorella grimontii]KFC97500.1 glutathione-regulated potassium-efflux system protein [Leminorella grimontii ATCC 33999 = DSM 5078]GKX55139.1 glutathione-regulated potassium-efflux system protein KefB [Leminorella grimontii]
MNDPMLLLVIILFVAAIAVTLSKKVGLGAILGLLLTGIVIGPHTPGQLILKEHVDKILHVSEFGIVLLLFIIGLEMQPRRLWSMRRMVFGLGTLQILLSGAAIGGYFYLFGYGVNAAVIIGLTLALSSTAFVIQILQDHNEFSSEHGRLGFAILLMQDLAIVPLLALVPLLSDKIAVLPDDSPMWMQTLSVIGALLVVIAFGRYGVPWILNRMAKKGYRESFSLFVMFAVVLAAYIMDHFGLSMALGAFIMGMMLSTSKYGFQIHASVESAKSLLMSLFFISVGMSIDFATLAQAPFFFISHVAVILLLKIILLFVLSLAFGTSKEAATKVAFLLCQGGEFGFVLFGVAKAFGVIDDSTFIIGIGVISVSMAFTPSLYALGCRLTKKMVIADVENSALKPDDAAHSAKVVVAGYGDTGYVLAQMLQDSAIPHIVIEKNPEIVRKAQKAGIPAYFGDITDPKLLNVIGVEQAQMVIVSIDHSASALKAVSTLRSLYPMLKILARVLDMDLKDKLLEAGANWVVIETLESSLHIGAEALKVLGVADDEVSELVDSLRKDEMLASEIVPEDEPEDAPASLIQTDTDFELPQDDGANAPIMPEQKPEAN